VQHLRGHQPSKTSDGKNNKHRLFDRNDAVISEDMDEDEKNMILLKSGPVAPKP
jgi:hypothetical protein